MNKLLWIRAYVHSIRRSMSTPATGSSVPPSSKGMAPQYRPSELQKLILVWTKKYKSKAEIPTFVSPDLIERSRSEARIKIANILMLLTALASFGAILSGKAAAKRGESVHQLNLDWHKQYQEDYDKKHGQDQKENK